MTAAFIGFVVVAIVVSLVKSATAYGSKWQGAATKLGLTLRVSEGTAHTEMSGTIDGYPVLVHGVGAGNVGYIRYSVTFSPLALDMRIESRVRTARDSERDRHPIMPARPLTVPPPGGLIGAVAKSLTKPAPVYRIPSHTSGFVGGPGIRSLDDVRIGDPSFDAIFEVYTPDADRLRSFLTQTRVRGLVPPGQRFENVVIHDTAATWQSPMYATTDQIVAATRQLVAVAAVLTDRGPLLAASPWGNEGVSEEADPTTASVATPGLHPDSEQDSPDPGHHRSLAPSVGPGVAEPVGDAELGRLRSEVAGYLQGHLASVEAGEAPVVTPAPTVSTSSLADDSDAVSQLIGKPAPPTPVSGEEQRQAELIRDLFAPAVFGEEPSTDHVGTIVAWTGEVRRVTPYRMDFDFPGGAGLKATVAVGQAEGRFGTDVDIDALVQLTEATDVSAGDTIRFSGRLLKVDSLMRQAFVAEAVLADARAA